MIIKYTKFQFLFIKDFKFKPRKKYKNTNTNLENDLKVLFRIFFHLVINILKYI